MIKKLLLGALAAASFNTMQGATVFLLDDVISTGPTPSGSAPWLKVTATDTVFLVYDGMLEIPTSAVKITLESNLQSHTEFFDKIGFVWADGIFAPGEVTQRGQSPSGLIPFSSRVSQSNSINFGVGTSVGLLVDFVNSNAGGGALRFDGTDTFEFTVYDPFGTQYNANTIFDDVSVIAHVNGIHVNGMNGDYSAWVRSAVPEPSTALLGLLGLAGLARRKR